MHIRRDNLLEMEKRLRAASVPYVAVNEAKKALFSGAKLKAFHFVVYRPTGVNVLLYCGERTKENIVDMRQWASIFGDGFRAVFAVRRSSGTVFRDLAGVEVAADDLGLEGVAPAEHEGISDKFHGMTDREKREYIASGKATRDEKLSFSNAVDLTPAQRDRVDRLRREWHARVRNDPPVQAEPTVMTPGVQGSLLGERYEGSAIGSKTPSMFGDMTRDAVSRVPADTSTLFLWS